jgi:hypothetical protein
VGGPNPRHKRIAKVKTLKEQCRRHRLKVVVYIIFSATKGYITPLDTIPEKSGGLAILTKVQIILIAQKILWNHPVAVFLVPDWE